MPVVPVQVPIIDHDNPFYCPNPLHFHSIGVSGSGVDSSPSSFSRDSAAPSAHVHERVKKRNYDQGANNTSIHAFVHGPNRVTDELPEEPVVGDKFESTSCDSSPCARFPSDLGSMAPARKRARYTSFAREPNSFRMPDDEWKEIKQEYSSPVLQAFPDWDERIHEVSKQEYEKTRASSLECSIVDGVTTRTLLLRLDEIFPRMGFGQAADSSQHVWPETNAQYRSERHQALVDLLGQRGALNEYALTALHDAEFRHLDLGHTMLGVNKLDLPRGDVMRVFSQPGWFKHLKTLSFAGGRFRDNFALTHIQPLRQIEKLVLANTGIGNEGVFHIVALKQQLRHLDLSENPSIDDDSIPALILLESLQYLSVFGTGVLLPGLRKLAVALKEGERVMDVKIPNTCKDYINGLHRQYLLHPAPPLISDPGTIGVLSEAALSRNLAAHTAINSTIVSTGSRNEMEERLRRILEVRSLDLVVREMLVGLDEAR